MLIRTVTLIFLFILAAPSESIAGGPTINGRLCLAAVPAANDLPKSLSNPSGGNPDIEYSVKVGGHDIFVLSRETGRWIRNLDTQTEHSIAIFEDGWKAASFYLSFEDNEKSMCLFLSPLYLTWQLWPMKRTGDWCACDGI